MQLQSNLVTAVLQTREELERMIEVMSEYERAQVDFASTCPEVRVIRAQTLPDSVAAERVLIRYGFRYVGEAVDPEDGVVSRFERSAGTRTETSKDRYAKRSRDS